jgi:hypothetical protein
MRQFVSWSHDHWERVRGAEGGGQIERSEGTDQQLVWKKTLIVESSLFGSLVRRGRRDGQAT